jgi:WD40 repeat protein
MPHSSGRQCEESSSSTGSIIGRKSKVVKAHDRQGRATIADLLSRVQSSFENPLESDDAEVSTSTSTSNSYITAPDHTSGMLADHRLSQKAVDLTMEDSEAQAVKASRLDIRGPTDGAEDLSNSTSSVSALAKSSVNEKSSSAHFTPNFTLPKPFDTFDGDVSTPWNAKSSFNLPKSFDTLRDDILRSWELSTYQTPPQNVLSRSPSIPKSSSLVEPLLGSSITTSVLDSSSNKSGNSQRNDGDAADTILNSTTEPSTMVPPMGTGTSSFRDALPISRGAQFTPAECNLIIYFKKSGMPWPTIDQKMGRSANCCATEYKKKGGLKDLRIQRSLRYHECLPLIQSKEAASCGLQETLHALTAFLNVKSATLTAELLRPSNAEIKAQPRKAIQEESSNISAKEYEHRRRLLLQPFKLNFPPLGSSKESQESDSDEGPRLRRRFNVKRYTFTKADFGYYSDDELPTAVSPSDSETEQESKISQRKPTGLREIFFESDVESDEMSLLKPYLSIQERRLIRDELRDSQTASPEELRWNGVQLHVPMSHKELGAIQSSIAKKTDINFNGSCCLYEFLKSKTTAFLRDVSFTAQRHPNLSERSRQSIEAFLNDASRGFAGSSGLKLGFESSGNQSLHPSLLHHELGETRNARTVRRTLLDSLQPAISFTGTSGDVGTVAWSPNGHIFAAGSACLVDENSMQYNRGNNLLLGDSDKKILLELPHHATKRKKPTVGPNSTDAMHVTQDPRLFETVSMLDFSPEGNYLYSVGYDNFLRAYDTSQQSSVEPIWSYNHGAKVDLLAVSSSDQQLLATGCQITDMALNIFHRTENGMESLISLRSDKANLYADRHILPSAIKWGKHPLFKHHLLAGFSSTSGNTESGEVCLYDVTRHEPIQMIPASGNIFDCAWSPNSWFCAAACTADSQVSRRIKSKVLIYQPDQAAFKSHGISLESSALDINDIVFCPYDYHYVAAGATDGKVYVWDIRKPDYLLHLFSHGNPLLELDGSISREQVDTGVRFCAWSYDCTRLFSGSSDGVVKMWDVFRSPEDAHMQDVVTLNSGVMSGAFNTDFTRLLLGEVNGSITVLEAGHESRSIKETDKFQLQQADDTKAFATVSSTEISDPCSGVALGRALRKSRQIKFKPLGSLPVRQAVQGRKYRGPFDLASDSENLRAEATKFQARMKPTDKENICEIPLCRETNNFVTQEEAGDSGRSTDRIPQAIRDASAQEQPDQQAMIPGMLKCSHCGRPARPRIGDAEQELFPLCERCGFECFRCGRRGKIEIPLNVVQCKDCGLQWRMGALGYYLTKQARPLRIQGVDGVTTRTDLLSRSGGGLEDVSDLLHLVEDYYQSLWEDKLPVDD